LLPLYGKQKAPDNPALLFIEKFPGSLRVAALNPLIPAAPVHPAERIARNGRFPCAFCRPGAIYGDRQNAVVPSKTCFLTA